jgi:hypothetical protein
MLPRISFIAAIMVVALSSAPSLADDAKIVITVEHPKVVGNDSEKSPLHGKRPAVDIAILLDTSNSMDGLIDQAKKQAAACKPGPGKGKPGEQMAKAQADRQVADIKPPPNKNKTSGQNPKQKSIAPGQAGLDQDLSAKIEETAAEWGKISPRTRAAVQEGADEQIIEKYRKYVEDYYKGVATRWTERE